MKNALIILMTTLSSLSCLAQTNFKVEINPKMEAISIYWTMATVDTFDIKPTPSIYYTQVKEYFKKCKDAPSLNWYRNLDSWDGYDISSLGLFLNDKAPFKIKTKPAINYAKYSGQKKFLYHFNQFYKNCGVKDFIESHQTVYNKVASSAFDTIQKSEILEDVQNFFGYEPKDTLTIFIDMINNFGNNAILVNEKQFPHKRFIRLAYLSDSTQTAESPVVFKPYLNVVAHEYTHTFVSDFIPKNYKELKKLKEVFTVTTQGEKLPSKTWKNELDELIVRSCVAKILALRNGKEAGKKEIENQALHFALASDVYNLLDDYIDNRNKYKTFEMFYPVLMNYFQEAGTKAKLNK